MKKVFLSLAVVASIAMVSCGKKADANQEATQEGAQTEQTEEAAANDQVTAETVEVVDSAAVANDSIKGE